MSQPDGADAGPLMSNKSGPEPVLTVTGLGVHRGRAEVLRDIDLTVAAGEIVAVLGPNGAGKSTLLNAAAGVLPVRSGHVQRHGRTALVMQAPGLARRSARANVELAMAWWGVPRRQRRRRARQALTLMRAEHLAARPARGLSGGEQRRIHLARAVAVAPDLMLLDEPFDGLDPETHAALREDAVAALRASAGAAVVVLHDRIDAWAMADRIVVLIDGQVHADGAPQQVLDQPPSAAVARFLGYDGQLRTGTGMLLTRAAHVRLDPTGTLRGTVTRRIGIEDGLRLEVETGRGSVWALHFAGDVSVGDEVSVAVRTGVEFPSD